MANRVCVCVFLFLGCQVAKKGGANWSNEHGEPLFTTHAQGTCALQKGVVSSAFLSYTMNRRIVLSNRALVKAIFEAPKCH